MIWIIIIIVFIVVLIMANSKSKKKANNGLPNSNTSKDLNISEISPSSVNSQTSQTTSQRYFYDKELYFEDKSYLSPGEARKEMNERKESGEWLEFEEYGGYMNAINCGRDDAYIEKIEDMSPEQVEKWYAKRMEVGKWITTPVFEAIASKLKPHHEEYLLKTMDSITQGRIEGWVNARKKEGYFFSYISYEKAEKIFRGEIDNRKKKGLKTKLD